MELRAGAHTKKTLRAVNEFSDFFRPVNRFVAPSINDYEQAGGILAKLQRVKGYEVKKCASITDDCLIAASARSMGSVLYTQNKKDFQEIQEVFDFRVSFL